MWQVTGQIFYGCREVLVVLKREMRTLIWCISLFVVYFRQTKLSVCSDPQEGSVAQCVEMAVHEGEAGDEFDVIRMRLCEVMWVKMAHKARSRCCSEEEQFHLFVTLKRTLVLFTVFYTKLREF